MGSFLYRALPQHLFMASPAGIISIFRILGDCNSVVVSAVNNFKFIDVVIENYAKLYINYNQFLC